MVHESNSNKLRVLFLCTGNSCRSQMAEALVNHYLREHWQAFSAGTQPAAEIHPLAIQALTELGINHQGEPKSAKHYVGEDFDLVITVCDDAAENCPAWLGRGKRMHIGFPDPKDGDVEQFRKVCLAIRDRVLPVLSGFYRALEQPVQFE